MNRIFIILLIFSLASCVKPEHKNSPVIHKKPILIDKNLPQKEGRSAVFNKSYILGSWKTTIVESMKGEVTLPEKGEITFFPTGKFKGKTLSGIHSKKLKKDLFSISSVESGSWRIENGKLVLIYESIGDINVKSAVGAAAAGPMKMLLNILKKEAKQNIGKDNFYRVKSQKKNSVDLFSKEDDALYQYTRIKK